MTNRWANPINNNILRDLEGTVLASGSVAFYQAGTSTPLAVYSDPELTISLGSFINADAFGLLPDFHLLAGTQYKMVAYDAVGGAGGAGAVKWTRDDVFGLDSDVDTRLDAIESSIAELEDIGRNSILNGGCSAENLDTDKSVIAAPNLTTSYAEGQVKGVLAKVANVTAGTNAIGYTTDVESGAYLHLSGVSTNNAAATADALFAVKSGEAARFVNKEATFRCKVYHDVGANVSFTVTVAALNSRDDTSAFTTIASGSTAVTTATWTTVTLTVPDMGNTSNGIAVIVSGAIGTITTKSIRYSVAMLDIGGALTSFTETDPNIAEQALNAQDFAEAYTDQEITDFAKRDAGSPWLNGQGAVVSYTTGSGNFTVPAGVYRVKYTVTGGGGGGGGRGAGNGSGGNGGDSTFNTTIVAGGGVGGTTNNNASGPAGGTATGGDINIPGGGGGPGGGDGQTVHGGASFWGGGGLGGYGTGGGNGLAYGSGGGAGSTGSTGAASGSAAGTCIGILTVTPGDLIPYVVGAAGAAGTGAQPGGAGASGIIVLEY